jgi:hypothetical protein
MNRHLSSRQISRWMIGEHTPQEERHVRECPECNAELARLEASLSLFRGSVRQWSDGQSSGRDPEAWKAERARTGFIGQPRLWALVTPMLLMLAVVPIYRDAQARQREAALVKADAVLMEQVDDQLSRAVPTPMEPLVKLVPWSSEENSTEEGGKVR